MNRRGVPALLAAALLAGGCFGRQYRQNPRVDVVGGDPIVQMKPASKFRNLSAPRMVRADRQSDPPTALERVLGIPLGTRSRAYPLGLLDRYEVVNDGVVALPYVVARCGLTGVAAVYDRRAGGRELEFENSGALWRDTLVLRDRQTGTYWSAATGAAISGVLAGARLERIPAVMTFSADWAREHPDSLYLDVGKSTSIPLTMRIYGVSAMQGVSGQKTDDARYAAKQEVLTLSDADEAIAFTSEEIEKVGATSVRLSGRTVRLEWDAGLQAPRAFLSGSEPKELALMPVYWFAVPRHFRVVRTLQEARQ
jgi:hypothetical protein